ncbi:MAG: DUF1902 domain-containing protein [Lachnospiraceae bacterium]|nr:DUF1902 domain-containing protein [Lachnospiraceae bacterium]
MEYTIKFSWDEEACVWIATSEDIHGLVLESGSFDALIEKVRYALPELLELNHEAKEKKIHFLTEREMEVYA